MTSGYNERIKFPNWPVRGGTREIVKPPNRSAFGVCAEAGNLGLVGYSLPIPSSCDRPTGAVELGIGGVAQPDPPPLQSISLGLGGQVEIASKPVGREPGHLLQLARLLK
jgi:hypothetical protein